MSASLFDIVRTRVELANLPVVIISDTPGAADEELRLRNARGCCSYPSRSPARRSPEPWPRRWNPKKQSPATQVNAATQERSKIRAKEGLT